MSKPEFDKKKAGNDSMFDFLEDDDAPAQHRPRVPERTATAPIIRKPVPIEKLGGISQTGMPGGMQLDNEEFGFLEPEPSAAPVAESSDLDIDIGNDWRAGVHEEYEESGSRWGVLLPILALLLLITGGYYGYTRYMGLPFLPPGLVDSLTKSDGVVDESPEALPETSPVTTPSAEKAPATPREAEESSAADVSAGGAVSGETASGSETPFPEKSLYQRFQEELEAIESLVGSSQLNEAEQALATMDRVVYGYGEAEFSELQTRIDVLQGDAEKSRQAEAAEQQAAEQQAAEQQAAEQQAAEQRAAEQQAAEQQAAEQQAAEQQAAEQQAAEQQAAEQQAAEQQAAEQQAAEQQATEQQATEQQATEQQAAEQQAAEQQAAEQQAEADRLAEIEQQAETTRQAESEKLRIAQKLAEAERLAEARRLEIKQEQIAAQADQAAATPSQPLDTAITDDDLQFVYSQFVALEDAIGARDINAVIKLTQPSGSRVQQFLQVFENTEFINSRIANVATRNADQAIVGRLIIESLVRPDGAVVNAPAKISSIKLTSIRGADGWSAIAW